jgi:hypothetical protein
VGRRVGDHVLDQAAVSLLVLGDLGELGAGDGKAIGQAVTDLFELGDAEDPRSSGRCDPPFDAGSRESGAEETSQLGLHAGDLAAQVAAGTALVGLGDGSLKRRKDLSALPQSKQLLLR